MNIFPTVKFRKNETIFWTNSLYEKETIVAFLLTINSPHKAEMEYHGKLGNTLGRI